MKAIKIIKKGFAAVVEAPIPSLPDETYLLVRTIAVGLNPSDWKHIASVDESVVVGCDFAGIVEVVGSKVTKPFKVGDRVAGAVHGSNVLDPQGGAFGDYMVTKGDLTFKIPDGFSFEEGAAFGVGIVTVGQGLYQEMGLPWPDKPLSEDERKSVLIYGGSSASGAFGIQFAKLSGFEVVTTCSPSNFNYVKSLGADKVFDYKAPNVGAEIREYTKNKLYYAWDCIGGEALRICSDAVASSAPEGQDIVVGTIVHNTAHPREDVKYTWSIAYTSQGKDVNLLGRIFPGRPDHFEFTKQWVELSEKLLIDGRWKPHRQEVRNGGFEGVLEGLEDLKQGKVSGVKLVYRIREL